VKPMGMIETRKFIRVAAVLLLLLSLLSCGKSGRINDVMVMDDTRDVLVYARLQSLLKEDTEKMTHAGVAVSCTFYVNFYQQKSSWFDHRLSSQVVRNTIKYDNIKKNIYVKTRLNGEVIDIVQFNDFGSAVSSLIDLNGISVAHVGKLRKTEKYYVEIKAKVGKDEHSGFVRYIMLFLPFMETETPWYRKEFVWKD